MASHNGENEVTQATIRRYRCLSRDLECTDGEGFISARPHPVETS